MKILLALLVLVALSTCAASAPCDNCPGWPCRSNADCDTGSGCACAGSGTGPGVCR